MEYINLQMAMLVTVCKVHESHSLEEAEGAVGMGLEPPLGLLDYDLHGCEKFSLCSQYIINEVHYKSRLSIKSLKQQEACAILC